jgi:anti-sigma B factor antagonist
MPLDIQIKKNLDAARSGTVTVELAGSLDTSTAPELEQQLAPVLDTPVTDLVFDLAGLKFISSAGLRVFANCRKRLKERGGQAAFIHMQPQIQEVFEIIKALPGVAIFKSYAEMDEYLAARQNQHRKDA